MVQGVMAHRIEVAAKISDWKEGVDCCNLLFREHFLEDGVKRW